MVGQPSNPRVNQAVGVFSARIPFYLWEHVISSLGSDASADGSACTSQSDRTGRLWNWSVPARSGVSAEGPVLVETGRCGVAGSTVLIVAKIEAAVHLRSPGAYNRCPEPCCRSSPSSPPEPFLLPLPGPLPCSAVLPRSFRQLRLLVSPPSSDGIVDPLRCDLRAAGEPRQARTALCKSAGDGVARTWE